MKDNQREDIKLAYIAGLIDGEGSIRMSKGIDAIGQNPKYTPFMSFVNTNYEAVKLIADFLGGTITTHDPSRYGFKNRKICYKTQKAGRIVITGILKKLMPYLLIKKPQAKLLIEYDKYFEESPGAGRGVKNGRFIGGRIRSEKETQRREQIYQKLKNIHGYVTRNDRTKGLFYGREATI